MFVYFIFLAECRPHRGGERSDVHSNGAMPKVVVLHDILYKPAQYIITFNTFNYVHICIHVCLLYVPTFFKVDIGSFPRESIVGG